MKEEKMVSVCDNIADCGHQLMKEPYVMSNIDPVFMHSSSKPPQARNLPVRDCEGSERSSPGYDSRIDR